MKYRFLFLRDSYTFGNAMGKNHSPLMYLPLTRYNKPVLLYIESRTVWLMYKAPLRYWTNKVRTKARLSGPEI